MPTPSSDPELQMSPKERANASVLIIEPDAMERSNMRNTLRKLGFGTVSDVPTHLTAFDKLEQRHFSHVVFDAKKTDMPVIDFVKRVIESGPSIICIPSSFEPNVDDVFGLLCMGARGYLVKPFTAETLDASIVNATKGEPLSDAIIGASDRNEALVAIVMHSLDKAATTLRQAREFETAQRELPRSFANLARSAELAHTFAKGGPEGFLGALERFCIERSKGPATRLGRLRKKLKKT